MIFITGDTHSRFDRFTRKNFPEQEKLSKKDVVIIAGDFGGIWYSANDITRQKAENNNLDELNKRQFTTAFIPGNHENYDRLLSEEFPTCMWNKGFVKQIRPSVLMLLRGEVYEIDGQTLFAFGGASSHDVSDGILNPTDPEFKETERQLKRSGKRMFRIKGVSWWEAELPTEEELRKGLENLEKHQWKVDYVVTHCAPSSIQEGLGMSQKDNLTEYLERIRRQLDYKKWFFGHYHDDTEVTEKDIMIYRRILRVE